MMITCGLILVVVASVVVVLGAGVVVVVVDGGGCGLVCIIGGLRCWLNGGLKFLGGLRNRNRLTEGWITVSSIGKRGFLGGGPL